MRKFDFKSENFQVLDIKNLIQKLILENYTIERIQNLLGITPQQMNDILRYKFEQTAMDSTPKKPDMNEQEMIEGVLRYTYENLSPIEKMMYDNLK